MRKLVPSRSWRFILGIGAVLIGLGSLAFSQLAEDPPEESPPSLPGGALPPLPGGESGGSSAAADPIKRLQADLATTRRALARAKQANSEADRLAQAKLQRMRKDLERSKDELSLAQRVIANDADRVTELTRLQNQVNEGLSRLKVREQNIANGKVEAIRKLDALENKLKATEGIFADSLAGGASPEEALPAITLLQDNLTDTHDAIADSLNESSRLGQTVLDEVAGIEAILAAASQGVTDAQEVARAVGRGNELDAAELRNNLDAAIDLIADKQGGASDPRLKPEIGELDIDAGRNQGGRAESEDIIRKLKDEVDASQGLQASLNEDVEKLRNELKQAFRQILSMQMKLEESNKLVGDLERQRASLLQSKNEGISGVEGMNRMVVRLEQELSAAKAELTQARESLNAEKIKSASVINTLGADLESTKAELIRVKALANVEGRDAVSMLELEEELNRTKTQLLALQRQSLESGSGSTQLKSELQKAFGEIMRLRADLSGKEDLEQQLANLESQIAGGKTPPITGSNPERVNELIRSLNGTKLALEQARAEQVQVRTSLSKQVADLEDQLQQSRDELDLAQVDMARKELEFSDLVKGLENELSVTQQVLRQAADAQNQGSDVIEIMDADLGAAQNRMQQLSGEIDKERMEAARLIRDLQVELEASRRSKEVVLNEVKEKDELLANKDDELRRIAAQAADLQNQLKEVDSMSTTLAELNAVLRSTESVQSVNVDQANALSAQLRDELEQAKVESLLAKEAKESVQRQAATRISSLEKQLKDTQNQLELARGQFHDVTGEGAELIAELKAKLNQADGEIARLKQAGVGETVGTENLASQLQEALGTIQVLQQNLSESESVNAEVDDLRLRLATAMESKMNDQEREDAQVETLRKKMQTLEMDLAMAQQAQSNDMVNSRQLFSKLNDELKASREKIAALQSRSGQSEASTAADIADLEEELARTKADKLDAERRMHDLLKGKSESVAALERELVLTKTKLDELSAGGQGTGTSQAHVATLEKLLADTKAELDDLKEREGADGSAARALDLENQLAETQKRLNALLFQAQEGNPSTTGSPEVVKALELQLGDARVALSELQNALIARDKENTEIEIQLEKALANMMDMQMAGNDAVLRQELDDLKRQLALAKGMPVNPVSPAPAEPNEADAAALALLRQEIDNLKKDLATSLQSSEKPSPAQIKLQSELEAATGQIIDLQTELSASKKKLQDITDLEAARTAGDDSAVAELSKRLQLMTDAIEDLKKNKEKTEEALSRKEKDAAALDDELEKSFLAMQKLKDEKDALAFDQKALNERIAGLEDLNAKLTAANKASQQSSENDGLLKRERDDLFRRNLELQTGLEKYKAEVRRLQQSLATPRESIGDIASMQDKILSLESQLQISKTSDATSRGDFDRVSTQLKDAMRQVMVLETNLAQAEGRIAQLQNTVPVRTVSPTISRTAENSTTKSLRDEVLRLRAELEAAQAASGSRSQAEDRLRDTSMKLLAAQSELERANQRVAILQDQSSQVEARRRSDVEREKAANQMVTLLNDKLKREEAKALALQEGLRKAREVIASLRGEPGAPSIDPGPFTRRSPGLSNPPSRTTSFTPRITTFDSPVRTPPSLQPRPLPSRRSIDDWRTRTRVSPAPTSEGVSFRPSEPVGLTVDRGNAEVDFEVTVQFLNNQIKPASNVEFFLTKERDIEDIVARAGIRLPSKISSAAELWARSIHRGYSYPGVAAKIRNALSQSSIARFKTNANGLARLQNLPAGEYFITGASPLGAVGVVWSKPIQVKDGSKVSLDVASADFAK